MKFINIILAIALTGCPEHTGDLGSACNSDGTCNGPHLQCVEGMNGFGTPVYFCTIKANNWRNKPTIQEQKQK